MSKQIPLSRGLFATVDDGDFEWLNQWNWSALKVGKLRVKYYAVRTVREDGKSRTVLMHRLIGGATKGTVTDHRDGDGLNNRRSNIRVCTQASNSLNHVGHSDRAGSRFKGVYWHKQNSRWVADFRGKYIGSFGSEEDAARAYDQAAMTYSPVFALPNSGAGREFCGTMPDAPPKRRVTSSGAYWHRRHNKWQARTPKKKHIGYFTTKEEALKARAEYMALEAA
jgi:hypothetical protein